MEETSQSGRLFCAVRFLAGVCARRQDETRLSQAQEEMSKSLTAGRRAYKTQPPIHSSFLTYLPLITYHLDAPIQASPMASSNSSASPFLAVIGTTSSNSSPSERPFSMTVSLAPQTYLPYSHSRSQSSFVDTMPCYTTPATSSLVQSSFNPSSATARSP